MQVLGILLAILSFVSASSFVASAGLTIDHDLATDFKQYMNQLSNRLKNVDIVTGADIEYEIEGETSSSWDYERTEPSLRQVILIHRHGDRTPIVFPSKDAIKDEEFWAFHGLGQLTNRGKARLFALGQIIRDRYNEFMGRSVNKNQRISRSSGSLRCIESGQSFLAGFLGLDQKGSVDAKDLNWAPNTDEALAQLWQPAAIQSVPVQFDGMLAEGAKCKVLSQEYLNIDASELGQRIVTGYTHEAQVLGSTIGFELDRFFKWLWVDSLLEIERSYFPDKMLPEVLQVYERTEEASNLAAIAYQSTTKAKRLRSGLLINDMLSHMKNARASGKPLPNISGTDQEKKFVHYIAHDLTLVVLLGMLDSFEQNPIRPDYAANLILELHQESDEWFVKIYYMHKVPSTPVEIHVERCEEGHPKKRCTLDKLTEVMKPYAIDSWQTWMKECGNDFADLNPYSPGS